MLLGDVLKFNLVFSLQVESNWMTWVCMIELNVCVCADLSTSTYE
jgi:hypothetical protein